jgi:ADP-ribosylglycohydrolase
MNIADRATGAVIGALIGDALGLGPHWYYDLAELRRDYGDWITGYTDPKPGRYHAGMKAGVANRPHSRDAAAFGR